MVQAQSSGCGARGQRCCTLADKPAFQNNTKALNGQEPNSEARFCSDLNYDVCDPVTDTCVDENTLACGEIGEPCCNQEVDIAGTLPPGKLCFDGYYDGIVQSEGRPDVYCDTATNLCSEYPDLTCGEPGEPCCPDEVIFSSEMYDIYAKDYSPDYNKKCVYEYNGIAYCTDGVCEKCSSAGDKCCQDESFPVPFCQALSHSPVSTVCIDGLCVDCGKVNQPCCDEYITDSFDFGATVPNDTRDFVPACIDNTTCIAGLCVKAQPRSPPLIPGYGAMPPAPGLYGLYAPM